LASATIDHIISITIFLAAILLFINLFGQTNQTAITYEQHRSVASKCSDLIDNILLNPGNPSTWGNGSAAPTIFGLQAPEFTQYQLSPFSLMRLASSNADTYVIGKQGVENYYYRSSASVGNNLLVSKDSTVSYSQALKLLGINNTYGFELTLTPTITVSIAESQTNPLILSINATGTGFPLAKATISYFMFLVSDTGDYPSYTNSVGTVFADEKGSASVPFPNVTDPHQSYGFIAYAHLGGLIGVGYHARVSSTDQYIVPIVDDLATQRVLLAHSYDLNYSGLTGSPLKFNATFVILSEDFDLKPLALNESDVPVVLPGESNPFANITIPTYTPGILIVAYQTGVGHSGVVMMPWGISALAFPVTFGGNPQEQEWVATDLRQVTINHVSYQAKLGLWSYEARQVVPER
jgi:hypothetical protein